MTASKLRTRGLSLVFLTVWAWLMIVGGLWLILEAPHRYAAPRGFFIGIGITLVAMGEFIAGVTADRLFDGADSRWTGAFELVTWLAIGGVAIAAVAGVLR